MSSNQSRAERNEQPQHKKLGRSGSSSQQRNFSGGSGKGGGGGTAPPPSSSSLSSNWSLKKSNNAQGGQSRVSGPGVTSDSSNASAARTVQNGAHPQPPVHEKQKEKKKDRRKSGRKMCFPLFDVRRERKMCKRNSALADARENLLNFLEILNCLVESVLLICLTVIVFNDGHCFQ